MKSIKKEGFSSRYFLTEQGLIYDSKTKKYIKPYKDHCFKLKTETGKSKTISLKSLFKSVYNTTYCLDNIESEQGEIWQPLKGSQDYYISDHGRLISYKGYKAKLLKSWENKENNGYLIVKLTINGKLKNYYIHRLVAENFKQTPISIQNYQVHHIDGNRYNNHASNLQWLTKEEHKKRHDQKNVTQ